MNYFIQWESIIPYILQFNGIHTVAEVSRSKRGLFSPRPPRFIIPWANLIAILQRWMTTLTRGVPATSIPGFCVVGASPWIVFSTSCCKWLMLQMGQICYVLNSFISYTQKSNKSIISWCILAVHFDLHDCHMENFLHRVELYMSVMDVLIIFILDFQLL